MSNFTKTDFNTIMNYIEYKIDDIYNNRCYGNFYLKPLHIVDELELLVKSDFEEGLFKDE